MCVCVCVCVCVCEGRTGAGLQASVRSGKPVGGSCTHVESVERTDAAVRRNSDKPLRQTHGRPDRRGRRHDTVLIT